eukprot:SAG11_NODE_12183_length_717_cov_0.880259_1_plen_168_part_10
MLTYAECDSAAPDPLVGQPLVRRLEVSSGSAVLQRHVVELPQRDGLLGLDNVLRILPDAVEARLARRAARLGHRQQLGHNMLDERTELEHRRLFGLHHCRFRLRVQTAANLLQPAQNLAHRSKRHALLWHAHLRRAINAIKDAIIMRAQMSSLRGLRWRACKFYAPTS